MRRFLVGGRVFTGDVMLEGRGVLVTDGRVEALPPADAVPEGADLVRLPEGAIVAPGFLDLQVNGAGGVLFNDAPDARTAERIAAAVRPFGVTGVLPTLITDERGALKRAVAAAEEAATGSGVLGVHLEGPFISVERKGVHDAAHIRAPEEEDIVLVTSLARRLDAMGRRVVLTLAPEVVDDATIARFVGAGVVVSIGHTAAGFERVEEALALGVRGFTHLSNAMPPILNRAPGPVAAALASRDAWCGLIADGFHVHPGLMRVMVGAKAPGKLFLVTDAMPPVGTDARTFDLRGTTIHRRDGRLVTEDGTLAGADIDMAGAVRNAVRLLDLPLTEALRAASAHPAAFLGLENRLGRIAPGRVADFAVIDDKANVLETWAAGEVVWQRRPDKVA